MSHEKTGLPLRVGLIGAGLAGQKRARSIQQDERCALMAVADVDEELAGQTAAQRGAPGCRATTDGDAVATAADLDVVVVSTINKFLAPFTIAALQAGKAVLCEKPLGRNLEEARAMMHVARSSERLLRTGFNHRHDPVTKEMHRLFTEGRIGQPLYVRTIYGHGGRPGYENEWRLQPELSGGGHLLDQGIHSLDLARWFVGEFARVFCHTATAFYPAAAEDNVFALLWTKTGIITQIHASLTQWRNRFEFEVGGTDGTLRAEGRGGSYGRGRLTWTQRNPKGGRPTEQVWEFGEADESWDIEWKDFVDALQQNRRPLAGDSDGLRAMELVDALYRSAREGVITPVVHTDL